MPFSPQMLDFLSENMLRDDKMWYKEHRDDFKRLVEAPMKEFTDTVTGYVQKVDKNIDQIHISRIFRDARRLRGRSYFRDNMWVSFGRVQDLYKSLPAFYFDISPKGAEYGFGYYVPPSEAMAAMRNMIISGSPLYASAKKWFKKQKEFVLYGDLYKRDRFPDASEEDKNFLNRRNIGITAFSENWDEIFSDGYADKVGKRLESAKPFYDLIMAAALMSE